MPTRSLQETIEGHPVAMVLSDPTQPDNPLIFVNESFEKLTLYNSEAAIGQNCRFLQCDQTDEKTVKHVRRALEAERDISVDILNEKANGELFLNRLVITPLRDDDGDVFAFLGIQSEIEGETGDQDVRDIKEVISDPTIDSESEEMLRELQHRVKNHLSMVVSLIRLQSRSDITAASFEALSHRVQSLALLYEELSPQGVADRNADTVPAGAYLSRVANTIGALDGRSSIRLNVECDEIQLPTDAAARLGLLLTEFLTNAFKHAFRGRDAGVIQVRLKRQTRDELRLTVEDDGVGMDPGTEWPFDAPSVETRKKELIDAPNEKLDTTGSETESGAGGSIVAALISYIDGDLRVTSSESGTIINLDVGKYALN